MQDVDLFIHMAEIAGVFVGFGALIAIRSGGSLDVSEVAGLQWVMSCAIWVVIAALLPILVSRYGVTGHDLWLACSPIALVLMAAMVAVDALSADNRADVGRTLATTSRLAIAAAMLPTFWLPTLALGLGLVAIMLGLFPDHEEALYLSAVGLGVFQSAMQMFLLVMWRRPVAG